MHITSDFKVSMASIEDSHLYLDVYLMRKGTAYGEPPFRGTGCPALDVGIIYLIWK